MKVVITGGTGFIGKPLVSLLLDRGHEVTVLTRNSSSSLPSGAKAAVWTATTSQKMLPGGKYSPWLEALEGARAVVNLAGEPIASRRWDREQKERIFNSRVSVTGALVEALTQIEQKPEVLISGSAVGYYGWSGDKVVVETASPGRDFLSQVCVAWEKEALRAQSEDLRVVFLRTGIVLANDGGALPRMLLPFRLFAGGPIASGKQWMPWIHRDDMLSLIIFLIENKNSFGPVNAVAPNPVTNYDFSRTLARVLKRPSWLPVPGPILSLALGEMANSLLLNGQRVIPAKALDLGFKFKYAKLETALEAILSS
ncbi:MAG: TIGR01777 family oxidoreductase [Desulfocucumaceae bacterium]